MNEENVDQTEVSSLAEKSLKLPFKEVFIIFFVFSFLGHYLEVFWAIVKSLAVNSTWYPVINDPIPLAAPYGLGAVAIALVVLPLKEKKQLSKPWVFLLSAITAGVVEFFSALIVVLFYGKNYFWDYSDQPLNLFGFTSVWACFLFGVSSLVFIYLIYPGYQKVMQKITKNQLKYIFWVLFGVYWINQVVVFLREFPRMTFLK